MANKTRSETSLSDIFANPDDDGDDTARRFESILYRSPGAKAFFDVPPHLEVSTGSHLFMGQTSVKSRSFLLSPVGMVLKQLTMDSDGLSAGKSSPVRQTTASNRVQRKEGHLLDRGAMPPPKQTPLKRMPNPNSAPPNLHLIQESLPPDRDGYGHGDHADNGPDPPDLSLEMSNVEEQEISFEEIPLAEAEDEGDPPEPLLVDEEENGGPGPVGDEAFQGGDGRETDRDTTQNMAMQKGEGQQDTPQNIETPEDPSETVLDRWYLTQPFKRIIVIEGHRSGDPEQNFWHSSAISKRLSPRLLVTTSGSKYRLVGPMEVDMTLEHGFSSEVVKKFVSGFPVDWKEIIQDQYLQKEQIKDKKHKNEDQWEIESKKPPSNKLKKPSKRTPTTKGRLQSTGMVRKSDKPLETPAGRKAPTGNKQQMKTPLVIPIDEVQCTRSGRRVLPPLAFWANERQRENARLNKVEVIAGTTDGTHINVSTPRLTGLEVDQDLVPQKLISSKIKKRRKNKKRPESDQENASARESRHRNRAKGNKKHGTAHKISTKTERRQKPSVSKTKKDCSESQGKSTKNRKDNGPRDQSTEVTQTQDKILKGQESQQHAEEIDEQLIRPKRGRKSNRTLIEDSENEGDTGEVPNRSRPIDKNSVSGRLEDGVPSSGGERSSGQKINLIYDEEDDREAETTSRIRKRTTKTVREGGVEGVAEEALTSRGPCTRHRNRQTPAAERADNSRRKNTGQLVQRQERPAEEMDAAQKTGGFVDEVDPLELKVGKAERKKPQQAHGNASGPQRRSKRLLRSKHASYKDTKCDEDLEEESLEEQEEEDNGRTEESAPRTRNGKTWSMDTMNHDTQTRGVTTRGASSRSSSSHNRQKITKLNHPHSGIAQRTRSRERSASAEGGCKTTGKTRSSQCKKMQTSDGNAGRGKRGGQIVSVGRQRARRARDRYNRDPSDELESDNREQEDQETEKLTRNSRTRKKEQREATSSLNEKQGEPSRDISGQETPAYEVVSEDRGVQANKDTLKKGGGDHVPGVIAGVTGSESETKEQSSDTESMKQAKVDGTSKISESVADKRKGLTPDSFDIYGGIMDVLSRQKQKREEEQSKKRLNQSQRDSTGKDEDVLEIISTAEKKRKREPPPAASVKTAKKNLRKATLRITPIAINGLSRIARKMAVNKSQGKALSGSFQTSPQAWSQGDTGQLTGNVDLDNENSSNKENDGVSSIALDTTAKKNVQRAEEDEAVRPRSRSNRSGGGKSGTAGRGDDGVKDVLSGTSRNRRGLEQSSEENDKRGPVEQPVPEKPAPDKPNKTDKQARKGTISITAKKGTLKRKRQLRELAEHHNMGFEEDMLAATPKPKNKKKKILYSDDSDDEELDAIPLTGMTPSLGIPSMKPFSSKKTPHPGWTPGLLQSVNRNETEQYIFRMQKRNKLAKQKSTPVVHRATSKIGAKPNKFQNRINIKESEDPFKVTEINHGDSDEDRDYYWSDEEV